MTGPRALVIEHERATPAGIMIDWLESHDADVQILPIDEGATPDRPEAYDLVVSLGSEFSAYDDHLPWLGEEVAFLRDATAAEVPVLGICFGGQLLARVLGSEVLRAGEAEIGWLEVDTDAPDMIAGGPWFQWHFDTFTPPPNARLLARNHVGPQAFVQGRSLGVQFHPEVGVEIMETWTRVFRHELDEHGVDPDALLEQTYRVADTARAVSWTLLEGFYDRVALLNERTLR